MNQFTQKDHKLIRFINMKVGTDGMLTLTCSEGGGDPRPHHRSKQHVERQDVLCIMSHILQLVLRGAVVQSQLPGAVPANKL